ncbi:MAG: FAD/NAD(P)-binding protein, partial [Armatimonadetes bacterium]|nr:FAD/NAD(P)-binding protein [Anaerolineae bacterium]
MLDWLIIGGGIHGTHVSLVLTQTKRVSLDRVRVLDPYPQALARWHAVTTNTGMVYLRSPLTHHLHDDQRALGVFARIHRDAPATRFIPTYSRPSLALFNHHAAYLIDKYRLEALRITGRAHGLTRLTDGWRVETSAGGIAARRVVLAISQSEQPRIPAWAAPLIASGAPVQHSFELGFRTADLPAWQHLVVIGGGITAVQTALTLANQHPGSVTLLMRHAPRIHDFDSDPCWMNALCLRDFHKISDYDQRRAVIQVARHPGSMPADVAAALNQAVQTGLIQVRTGDVADGTWDGSTVRLHLGGGETLTPDRVLLATGWATGRPGGAWLTAAIQQHGLATAADGFPLIDGALCWAPGLYVSGALAELEV